MRFHQTVSHTLKRILIGTTIIFMATITARSEEITFRISFDSSVTLPQGTKMIGFIKMKTPQLAWHEILSVEIPNPGQQQTNEINCTGLGKFFTAELTSIYYRLQESGAEKQCRPGLIEFVFREKEHAGVLRRAIETNSLIVLADNSKFLKLHSELTKAIEDRDGVLALIKSSELQASLTKAGYYTQAEPYRVLNIDLAKDKLKLSGKLDMGAVGMVFDQSQKKFVLDDKAVSSLKQFQIEKNLAVDGKLNWQTMKTLGRI